MCGGVAYGQPISLNGSTTVMNALVIPKKAQIEALSGQQIVIIGNGSQRGLADLVAGKAQIAMISAPLEVEVRKFNTMQPAAIDLPRLTEHRVGESRVALVVHPSNSVRTLSNARIADILAGRIVNWKDVGGSDQLIVVVAAQPGDGVRSIVETQLLKGGDLTKDVRARSNVLQVVKVVSQLPSAIGIAAATSVDASVAELKGDAPIMLPLIFVTAGDMSPQVRQVIEATAKAGQP
jgi:phosphate transport system substrate-binding protein